MRQALTSQPRTVRPEIIVWTTKDHDSRAAKLTNPEMVYLPLRGNERWRGDKMKNINPLRRKT